MSKDDMIGRAELDALVRRLRATPLYEGSGEGSDLGDEAADAITALRALPDWKADYNTAMQSLVQAQNMIDGWKAMAERLGEALENRDGGGHDDDCKVHRPAMGFFAQACNCGHDDARDALSDLAKMKDQNNG